MNKTRDGGDDHSLLTLHGAKHEHVGLADRADPASFEETETPVQSDVDMVVRPSTESVVTKESECECVGRP